ncbi:MAG: aminoacyl-tRNA hydrolase [Tissierellia bacterium]|nr:aminoacyl-tRNA hydrolase [Tissierellia bacterium]
MYLIVGLGNPGKKYEKTRHNVGFSAIDKLAEKLDIDISKLKFKGMFGQGSYKGEKIILLKPQTYMNNSGEAVQAFYNYYNLENDQLIVLVDDIDIEFASVRIKKKGSAGTHNGMKSIIKMLGHGDFPRVKIAVGKKPSYMDLADFVLGRFTTSELDIIEKELDLAVDSVIDILDYGLDHAMNKTNSIKFE